MEPKQPLTADDLRRHVRYDPATGRFVRLIASGGRRAGTAAGCFKKNGYITVSIQGQEYYAHRLAWLYMTGMWPKEQIDHANGVRTDNRFGNLREADRFLNTQNLRSAKSNSKSGILGVSPHKGRWRAFIHTRGKTTHLGVFDSAEDAGAAYERAKLVTHPGAAI